MSAAPCDVVVVGAGAAGLAAGRALIEAGLDIRIVEARTRAGGRAFTDSVAGQPFDAGAAYIHFADRNPWVALAAELGVTLEKHRGWGGGVAFRDGRRLDAGATAARRAGMAQFWDAMETAREEQPASGASLADLAAGLSEEARDAALRFGQHAIGEEPERIDLADLVAQWEGPDLVAPGGYGHLVAAAARDLPVSYGVQVTRIDWGGKSVRVETTQGAMRARHVVVTVPVGVLRAGGIAFTPALPAATRDALSGMTMGVLSKVALAFDGARFGWPSPSDAYALGTGFNFELFPFGRDLVIATLGGDVARDLMRQGDEAAIAETLDVFASIVGGEARQRFVAGRTAAWMRDPFAEGGYSVVRPGHGGARAALREPVGGRVRFAGEATAEGGSMTVGGATLEGRRAAAEIVEALA